MHTSGEHAYGMHIPYQTCMYTIAMSLHAMLTLAKVGHALLLRGAAHLARCDWRKKGAAASWPVLNKC